MASEGRLAARGSVALIGSQAASKALALGFVLVATRQVGAEQFGRYAIATSLLVFANFMGDFGTTAAVVRTVARNPASSESILRGTALGCAGLGLISGLSCYAFVHAANYTHSTEVDAAIVLGGVPAQALLGSVLGAFDGRGALGTRSLLGMLQSGIILVGGVCGLLATGDVRSAMLALGLAPWITLVVATLVAQRQSVWSGQLGVDPELFRGLLILAVPFGLGGTVVALSLRFDVILLSLFRSGTDTAVYELAVRATEAVAIVGSGIANATTFVFNRRISRGDVEGTRTVYREAAHAVYVVGLLMSSMTVVLADSVTKVLFGQGYEDVALPLVILGSVQWIAFLVQLEGSLTNSRDDLKRSIFVSALCLSATMALDLLLIPAFGVAGAAVAGAVGIVVTSMGLDIFHRRTLGIGLPLPPVGLMAAFVSSIAIGITTHLPAIEEAILALATYVGVAFATGGVNRVYVQRITTLLGRPK